MPVKMKGFMRPFGTAPADFDAQTIIDLSETKAFLNVGFGFEGKTLDDVFTETPAATAPLILDGETIHSVGFFHSVIRGGNVIDFVKDHPGEDITIRADANRDSIFVITVYGYGGARTVYTSWSEFITAFNSACADGALITHLHGLGTFNDNTLTFSAYRLSLALVKLSDTDE
jgi:acyl CoA:acetate/3-ketoacid CoA transferase alpha subunit